MKEENIYDNKNESVLLFKARTGTLDLNIEKRHKGEDTQCELCKAGEETDIHFMLECDKLEDKRDKRIMRKYRKQDKEAMIGEMLFRKEEIESVKTMINNLWRRREYIRKRSEKKKT